MQDNQPERTLLLIDGLNIARRCYEANPAEDSPDKAQAAVRSAFGSFKRALSEHKPDFAVAAFDFGGHTWRHDLYPDYRAKRKPMPQVLRDVLPQLKAQLEEKLDLASVTVEGVEADDVLALLQGVWSKAGKGKSIVMSTDKDLAFLMTQGALIRDHFAPEWRNAAWVEKKFFVRPELLHDVLALMGDEVDGVPGVAGIGAKTAAKLLNEHGGLDQVLAAAATMKGAVGEKLRAQADMALLSRKLVAFKTDFPLGLTWSAIRMQAPGAA